MSEDGIKKIEFLLDRFIDSDRERGDIYIKVSVMRSMLKKLNASAFSVVNTFIRENRKCIHAIDCDKCIESLGIEDSRFKEYLELVKRHKTLSLHKMSDEMYNVYVTLDEFEKRYYNYLVDQENAMVRFLKKFKNTNYDKVMKSVKGYEPLKSKIIKNAIDRVSGVKL